MKNDVENYQIQQISRIRWIDILFHKGIKCYTITLHTSCYH